MNTPQRDFFYGGGEQQKKFGGGGGELSDERLAISF
jgi:hypothetical protein